MSQPNDPRMANPYASPKGADTTQGGVRGNAACPNCGSHQYKPVAFSLWGGVLGPKLLNHVKCMNCRTKFNGKTGRSNLTAIIVYQVVLLGIALVAFAAYYLLRP